MVVRAWPVWGLAFGKTSISQVKPADSDKTMIPHLERTMQERLDSRATHYPAWNVREPRARIAVMVALLYAAAVVTSLLLARLSLEVSTIWLPSGVGLIAVLLWGYWLLPLIALVHVSVSFAVGELSLIARIGIGAVATAEIGVAAWLLCRGRTSPALIFDLAETARFALICLLLVPMAGGLTAAIWLWGIGVISSEEIPMVARNWWIAVALGILCITPLVGSWLVRGFPRLHGGRKEALAVLAVLVALSALILVHQISQQRPVEGVIYTSLPILLWASIFFRETGASTALAFFTLLAMGATHLLPDQTAPVWSTAAHVVAFGLMALVIANSQTNLEQVVSERARREELEELAFRDMLTGLANRNRLLKTLDDAMCSWHHDGAAFAVLMIDLDGFKPVNDTYGHHAGDEVLRIVGARLENSMKRGDLIARFGGDEFVAVLEGCPNTAKAAAAAERLMQAINRPITIQLAEQEEVRVEIGASIGIAHPEHGAEKVETLMKQADIGLYKAKEAGRSRIIAYSL